MNFKPRALFTLATSLAAATLSPTVFAESYGYAVLSIHNLIVWKGVDATITDKTDRNQVGTQWDLLDFIDFSTDPPTPHIAIANAGSTTANLGSAAGFDSHSSSVTDGDVDTPMSCQGNPASVCTTKGPNQFGQFQVGENFNRADNLLQGAVITLEGAPSHANADMVAEFEHNVSDSSRATADLGTNSGFRFTVANDGQTMVVDMESYAYTHFEWGSDVAQVTGQLNTTFRLIISGNGETLLDWRPGLGISVGTQHINGGDSLNHQTGLAGSGPATGSEGNTTADFWRAESLPLTAGVPYQFFITSSAQVYDTTTLANPPPQPDIEVKKYVSVDGAGGVFHDAQTAPGIEADAGNNDIWFRVVINNIGNENLVIDSLTDGGANPQIPQAALDTCLGSPPTILPVDGSISCDFDVLDAPAVTAQYSDLVTATAHGQNTLVGVDDSDPANYFVEVPPTTPAVQVKKYVSVTGPAGPFDDAQSPTGPQATAGSTNIYFRVVINNTGNEDLVLDTLTDTITLGPNTPIPTAALNTCLTDATPDPFEPGDSFECDFGPFNAPTENLLHGNRVNITAHGVSGALANDADPAHYFVEIKRLISIPTLPHWGLGAMGLLLLWVTRRRLRKTDR